MRPILLILAMVCYASLLCAQVNLDSGLVAYYPFSGNADDLSGNDNHGVVMGALLTADRFGSDSAAYEFDGASGYITIESSTSLESPVTELSQVAWINIYSWSLIGSEFGPILMKSNSSANAFQYRLSVGTGGVNTAINNWLNAVVIADSLAFNEWYMIVSTLTGNTVKSWVNGVFLGEDSLMGPINFDSKPLEIGRDVPGILEVFHGKIDDVRIYNRALTDAEVQELLDLTTITDQSDPTLPDRYQLSQNYPNPFNPTTTIRYGLPVAGDVSLVLYDILGKQVKQLAVGNRQSAGYHSVQWDGTNDFGQKVASGIYVYVMNVGEFNQARKLLLNR